MSYQMSLKDLINRAEELVSAKEIANVYGLEVGRNKNYCKCPFHLEKTGSMYLKGNYMYCFGCGWSGNVIRFIQDYFGLDVKSALAKANLDFRLGLPLDREPTEKEKQQATIRMIDRKAEEQRKKAKEQQLAALWDEWAKADIDEMKYAPQSVDEEPDDRYVQAVKRKQFIQYKIDNFK